jgi:hypothetical protein
MNGFVMITRYPVRFRARNSSFRPVLSRIHGRSPVTIGTQRSVKIRQRPARPAAGTGVGAGALGQATTPGPARLTQPTHVQDPELTQALEEQVEKRPVTRRLRTHPGVVG